MSNTERFIPVRLAANSVVYKTCAETRCCYFCDGVQPAAIGHVLRDGNYPLARIGNCEANKSGKYPILDESISACNRFAPSNSTSGR